MGGAADMSGLFAPFAIGAVTLRNRFVMPAMQRGWCEGGRPTERMAAYYRRRAEGGVGLIIGESAAVDHPTSSSQLGEARLYGPALDGWAECIAGVGEAGGRMLLQLWHEGAVRRPREGQPESLSPSGLVQRGKPNGRAASEAELAEIRDAFVRSALSAQRIGAAGVEIHAAHGYGLDLFLWAETNLREDRYGGPSIADRLRFPAEIVAAIRAAAGPDFLISFRFSQWKEVDFGARIVETPEELGTFITGLEAAGVDIFHPSTRRLHTPEWEGSPLGLAGWCKRFTDRPVIAVGSVGLDCDVMDNLMGEREASSTGAPGFGDVARRFEAGEFDLLGIGRSLIGDPDWVSKVGEGRFDELRGFTREDLFAEHEWDLTFVAEAHGLVQGDGALLGRE